MIRPFAWAVEVGEAVKGYRESNQGRICCAGDANIDLKLTG